MVVMIVAPRALKQYRERYPKAVRIIFWTILNLLYRSMKERIVVIAIALINGCPKNAVLRKAHASWVERINSSASEGR